MNRPDSPAEHNFTVLGEDVYVVHTPGAVKNAPFDPCRRSSAPCSRSSGAAAAEAASSFKQNPVLFVHGIEGSGAQFESQKMRFMSNGYPARWIDEVDYNSTRAVGDKSEVHQQIDDEIAALKQRTGKSQVDVVAHSLGTSVMYDYLTNGALAAQRRANVAHYINVDGQSKNPGVPTLAVWAGRGRPAGPWPARRTSRSRTRPMCRPAPRPSRSSSTTSSSPASRRRTTSSGRAGRYEIAGKALNFPENSGASGTTVQVWRVNDSGQRTSATPVASVPVTDGSTGGGAWGPVTVQAASATSSRSCDRRCRRSTSTTSRSSGATTRSVCSQSEAIEQYAGNRPGSDERVNIRYKELWGDQGAESDQLLINGLNSALRSCVRSASRSTRSSPST